jgi:tripartite-type tricarboxylate transporter receptor subunit TctC
VLLRVICAAGLHMKRRTFLQLAAGAATLPILPRVALAQIYPTRPVHLLVGYAAGSLNDVIARFIGQMLAERLGQQFVIEDRPGAGSNLATEAVVRAPPDGYTLLESSGSNAWNATLYDKLNFDFIRDVAPVASTVRTFNVLEVHPSFPADTVPEFIAYAKANPGRINMASAGIGSSPHLFGELFKTMAGVDLLTVHYNRGSPLPDLIGGQVQVMFGLVPTSIEHIRAGRLKALAVTTATRQEVLPDIPAMAEFVPGYEATSWQGISAPRTTPVEVVEKLNKEINAGLVDPKFKARLAFLGAEVFPQSRSAFGTFVAEYTHKWAKVIRAANIKAE